MTTKEQVQKWAREEWERLDREKLEKRQKECNHIRSGTFLNNTFVVICDNCDKEITSNDVGSDDSIGARFIR